MKDQREVKRGREKITFKAHQLQKRRTVAAGFLGIGRYPAEIRDRLVTIVPPGPWKSAFFLLPSVGDAKEVGIRQVDLQIRLKNQGTTHQTQVVRWTPDSGWTGRQGKQRNVLAFGLMDLRRDDPKLEHVSFESVAQITVKNDVVSVANDLPVDDEMAIATPLSLAKVVRVDGGLLEWQRLNQESDLVSVSVTLRSGTRSFSGRLRPKNVDGQWAPPEPVNWIVPRDSGPLTADIRFLRSGGTEVPWRNNNRDLAAGQEQAGDLFIDLMDSDWSAQ
jgi:hypothetical protein